jgi:hypothetical protein
MPIPIYGTRVFLRSIKKSEVSHGSLVEAVGELALGLHDGNLGRGLFKKRIALPGHGKRGSIRTLVALKAGSRCFFLYGFKKNERSNISEPELEALRMLARDLLALDDAALCRALLDGALMRIDDAAH